MTSMRKFTVPAELKKLTTPVGLVRVVIVDETVVSKLMLLYGGLVRSVGQTVRYDGTGVAGAIAVMFSTTDDHADAVAGSPPRSVTRKYVEPPGPRLWPVCRESRMRVGVTS